MSIRIKRFLVFVGLVLVPSFASDLAHHITADGGSWWWWTVVFGFAAAFSALLDLYVRQSWQIAVAEGEEV